MPNLIYLKFVAIEFVFNIHWPKLRRKKVFEYLDFSRRVTVMRIRFK